MFLYKKIVSIVLAFVAVLLVGQAESIQSGYLVVTAVSILGFVVSALLLLPFFSMVPLVREYDCYYDTLAMNFPWLYVLLMGVQFGLEEKNL